NGKDKSTAEQLCGVPVVWRMDLHDWIPTLEFLEGCPGDSVVGVLSWRALQRNAALRIQSCLRFDCMGDPLLTQQFSRFPAAENSGRRSMSRRPGPER